ncbi:hypothetical protein [Spirosoma koreense]
MTDAERDELIEKSLLHELDTASEAQVQQLRQQDDSFRQAYDFQELLIQQVRLKRRQELLNMFAEFEAEQESDTSAEETPGGLLAPRIDPQETPIDRPVRSLWQQSWFRAAAVVALGVLAATVWWQLARYDPSPVARDEHDSVKIPLPTDSGRRKLIEPHRIPVPEPQGPVAHQPVEPTQLRGAVALPYYETEDVRLGFGQDRQSSDLRVVIFNMGEEPAYEFRDTLKVYLPVLPAAKPAWTLVYNRSTDTYYLLTGKTRYELVRGLQARQPLRKAE